MKFIPQKDTMDCGPACLAMVASEYKKNYPLDYLRDISFISKEGVSLLGISEAARKMGFSTHGSKLSTKELINLENFSILHWNDNHFVVLRKVKKSLFKDEYLFKIADPAYGFLTLTQNEFEKLWLSQDGLGVALNLLPLDNIKQIVPPKRKKISVTYLFKYVAPHRRKVIIMLMMLFLGSGITLIFPFLTEYLIDKGVNAKNLSIIYFILGAQLSLFVGAITMEIIRNWLVLYIGTKVSIGIISDFLKKILKLPIKFFDTKMLGDFHQRIQDNERIENFLTSQSLTTFFSFITFLVFFGVLWYYDLTILLSYMVLTVISVIWSTYWLKKRRYLDYFKFKERGRNQNSIYEILNGVTEIKLNQFEDFKRKEWKKIQDKLFQINIRILKVDQLQLSGFQFLNQLKNIIVTFLAATYVVGNIMTLGELLSVSYIIGAMNSPINQLITFFRSLQDAKLSLERLNEVQNHPEEDNTHMADIDLNTQFSNKEIGCEGIEVSNVNFQYEGPKSPFILKDVSFYIPKSRTTAIVGASGSGKTTLIKLMLKFYDPASGNILINNTNIKNISSKSWRENCGIVMQDGYIFSDTIERNIAMGDEQIDREKLSRSLKIANIEDFINTLPLGLLTPIGASGNGISGGQKQRLLIARAVYKNPHYIFFDEATSALDAENEKIIHDNLQEFFKGKTVLIIAHRLSTVKNADQIIVLDKGKIVEIGNHVELVRNQSSYFNLVKNQLELGA